MKIMSAFILSTGIIALISGCGGVLPKPTEKPRSFLEEQHVLAKCYTIAGNGIREKYLINKHPTRKLLVRTKTVFRVSGQPQMGDGEINEHIVHPGEKVNVGCEGWGMDIPTQLYAIYRHNVHHVYFLKE